MEQGDDDAGGFLTAEIVRGKERDQYGDEDRRDPIGEASPFRMPLIHEFLSAHTVTPRRQVICTAAGSTKWRLPTSGTRSLHQASCPVRATRQGKRRWPPASCVTSFHRHRDSPVKERNRPDAWLGGPLGL